MLRSLNRRRISASLLLAALAGVACPQATNAQLLETPLSGSDKQAAGPRTVGVVALSGYDELFADIGYLGGLVGRPESGQAIEGMIGLFTQGKGLVGLDKTKPWGVVVEASGAEITPVICLPIADLDAILQLAQAFGVFSDDAGGGVTELTIPNSPQPLFAKQVGEWVYLAQTAESLDTPPADPSDLLADLVSEYDFAARVLVQNIPALYRQLAIDGLSQGFQAGLEQEPNESDDEFAERKQLAEAQIAQLQQMIEEFDQITVGLAVNEAAGKGVILDFTGTAVPGSDLAKQMSAMEAAKTSFAGFADDAAALHFTAAAVTPPEIMATQADQIEAAVTVFRKQAMKGIDEELELPSDEAREALKAAANDLLDVYEEVALGGKIDAAGTVRVAPDQLTILAGAAIDSSAKVESALKKLANVAAEQPGFPPVEWDAHTHSGVRFHTITLPVPPRIAGVGKMLGEAVTIAVGIGDGRVYLAAGTDWQASITAAIDESAAKGPTSTVPVIMQASLRSIADVVKSFDSPNQALAGVFAEALANSEGDDHIRVVVDSTANGSRTRITVEEGVLRAAATLAESAARQAQAGAGGF